ncbi:MAG: alkane 1-monooxygenase [Pseudomonadota bacterium]
MARFATATLIPAILIALAAYLGGAWVWLALGYLTLFILVLDRLGDAASAQMPEETEFPAATWLLITLGCLHFFLLGLLVWSTLPAAGLDAGARIGVAIAIGLTWGQISHPVAHELIHARHPAARRLGRMIYTSVLAGHHASAHLRLHHVHVGTLRDPNTPRRGEGFYRYALRASRDSFLGGWREESRLHRGSRLAHPYVTYLAGGTALVLGTWALAGPIGALTLLVVALHAQMQILMSDYVQHYGLERQIMPDGHPEPVGPQHAWNAPHIGSSALMLNATRHSHHHMDPRAPFPALDLDAQTMPMLPKPLPVMAAIALLPPLWRRIMDPLCAHWRHRDWQPRKSPQTARAVRKAAGLTQQALPQSRHVPRAPLSPSGSRSGPDLGKPGAGRDERRRI